MFTKEASLMTFLCLETVQCFISLLSPFFSLKGGWTALMWACYKGRTEVVELLLSHGANPSVTGLVSVNKKFICNTSGKFF